MKHGTKNIIARVLFLGLFAVIFYAIFDYPFSNPAVQAHFFVIFALAGKH